MITLCLPCHCTRYLAPTTCVAIFLPVHTHLISLFPPSQNCLVLTLNLWHPKRISGGGGHRWLKQKCCSAVRAIFQTLLQHLIGMRGEKINSVMNIFFRAIFEILQQLVYQISHLDLGKQILMMLSCSAVCLWFLSSAEASGWRKDVGKVCLLFVSSTMPICCEIPRKSKKTERFLPFNRTKP